MNLTTAGFPHSIKVDQWGFPKNNISPASNSRGAKRFSTAQVIDQLKAFPVDTSSECREASGTRGKRGK